MSAFEERNALVMKKMQELLAFYEEKDHVGSFRFYKEIDKYSFYQKKCYKIELSNRSLKVESREDGKLIVIYEKYTNKSPQKHKYNLTRYEINAVSAVLNKIVEDFKKNIVIL